MEFDELYTIVTQGESSVVQSIYQNPHKVYEDPWMNQVAQAFLKVHRYKETTLEPLYLTPNVDVPDLSKDMKRLITRLRRERKLKSMDVNVHSKDESSGRNASVESRDQ
jgi:hypothetical protein